jgi:hypothetical protein
MAEVTLVDRWIAKAKNHPVIAAMCFLVIALGGLGSFTDSVGKLRPFFVGDVDQRSVQQEKIAKDISTFIFAVKNMIEFAENNMTAKNQLHFVVEPYNVSVETLLKNEYIYLAAIQRYWDKSVAHQYEIFISDVRSVDSALHRFNDEYAAVEAGAKKKADEHKLKPLVADAAAAETKLQMSANELLVSLSR